MEGTELTLPMLKQFDKSVERFNSHLGVEIWIGDSGLWLVWPDETAKRFSTDDDYSEANEPEIIAAILHERATRDAAKTANRSVQSGGEAATSAP